MENSFFKECASYSKSLEIDFFSSPIGLKSLQLLLDVDATAIKISSYEITNIPFLTACAETKLPLIISTGGCLVSEIAEAVECVQRYHTNFELLHCVIQYPSTYKNANLNCIKTMRDIFGIPVGFSNNGFLNAGGQIDYTDIPFACGVLDSSSYEVHITLDRKGPGVDQGFSIEPFEQIETVRALARGNEKKH